MISQTTTIEDLHVLYPADILHWSQVTTRVYASRVWQMTVEVIERLVVDHCSTELRWAELNLSQLKRSWSEVNWTDYSESWRCLYTVQTDLRDTRFLLLMSRKRPFKFWSLSFSFFLANTAKVCLAKSSTYFEFYLPFLWPRQQQRKHFRIYEG